MVNNASFDYNDRMMLYQQLNQSKAIVENQMKEIDTLNSLDNQNILGHTLDDFEISGEKLYALKETQNSKAQACAKGLFFTIGGSAALVGLVTVASPIMFIVAHVTHGQTLFLKDTIFSLVETIREGFFCLSDLHKENAEIEEEITQKKEHLKQIKQEFSGEFRINYNNIVNAFNKMQKEVNFIKENEKKCMVKMSKNYNSEVIAGVGSETVHWDGTRAGIIPENTRYVQLTNKVLAVRNKFDQLLN
jgi:hypothetical protein